MKSLQFRSALFLIVLCAAPVWGDGDHHIIVEEKVTTHPVLKMEVIEIPSQGKVAWMRGSAKIKKKDYVRYANVHLDTLIDEEDILWIEKESGVAIQFEDGTLLVKDALPIDAYFTFELVQARSEVVESIPEEYPGKVNADIMEADNSRNTVRFIGNVTYSYKDSHFIRADAMTFNYSEDRKTLKINAQGNPATYSLIAPTKILCMSAKKMEFLLKERTITLIGDAKIFEGQDEYTGSVIGYDFGNQRIIRIVP